jgi:transposase
MAERGGRQRDALRENFWRRTIRQQQQQRSGLTVRAFCLREGLKDGAFRWWQQALARRAREMAPATQTDRDGERIEAAPTLLPVRLLDLEAIPARPSPPIEVVLPTGPTVRVTSGFDPRTLGQVLAVLEGRPC